MSDINNSTEVNSTAETTNQMVREAKKSILLFFGIALVLAIALVYYNFGSFFANQIYGGEMFFLGIVIVVISTFISAIVLLVKYTIYKRSLSCAKDKGHLYTKRHRVIICVIVIVGSLFAWGGYHTQPSFEELPFEQFTHSIKFPLLSDISPQESDNSHEFSMRRERFVAPNVFYLDQFSAVGNMFRYNVRYYEMRNESFAIFFERELRKNAEKHKTKNIYVSGFDSALYFSFWHDAFGRQTYLENVILRSNNIIIRVTYIGSANLFDNLYQFSLAINGDM